VNCSAPLPGDDDGPFPANDPFLPSPGVTPVDAGDCGGPLRSWLFGIAWVVLLVFCGVVVAAAVQS